MSETNFPEIFAPLEKLFDEYEAVTEETSKAHSLFSNSKTFQRYLISHLSYKERYIPRNFFDVKLEDIQKEIDKEYWERAFTLTSWQEAMSAAKREEWQQQMEKRDFLAFTKESVLSTMQDLYSQLNHNMGEKVDGIFHKLSKEHVTNSPEGFYKRLIFKCYDLVEYSYYNFLTDLVQVIHQIVDKPISIQEAKEFMIGITNNQPKDGKWYPILGNWMKCRTYKNGNAHIEVHPDIAWQLNKILASYGNNALAIPDKFRKPVKKKNFKPLILEQEYLHPNTLFALRRGISYLYSNVVNGVSTYRVPRNRFGYTGNPFPVLKAIGGKEENGEIVFDYKPENAISRIIDEGYIPDYVSHQFYPTPDDIANELVKGLQLDRNTHVLEPSAGNGALIKALLDTGVDVLHIQAVEISEVNVAILKERFNGISVHHGDFMKFNNPIAYDLILMNPPFTGNQAAAHVEKAYELLAPGGELRAIVPESFFNRTFSFDTSVTAQTYTGFDKTNIKVRILTVRKPK